MINGVCAKTPGKIRAAVVAKRAFSTYATTEQRYRPRTRAGIDYWHATVKKERAVGPPARRRFSEGPIAFSPSAATSSYSYARARSSALSYYYCCYIGNTLVEYIVNQRKDNNGRQAGFHSFLFHFHYFYYYYF